MVTMALLMASLVGMGAAAGAGDDDYPGWHDAPLPDGPAGAAIELGRRILMHTPENAPAYSGNVLNCTSCHLDAGRRPWSSPWVGVWGVFPEYRSRNARMNSLQGRIADCFERSLNGKAPPDNSDEMLGMLAYLQWLSRAVPTGKSVTGRGFSRLTSRHQPDPVNGRQVYADKCALCHGADGQGTFGASGEMVYPPLWGDKSFNIGAGMARLNTAAAFVKANMPFGQGGSLSDEDAIDVAAYFTTQPRPDFPGKGADWPGGGKPKDARY
ncbi:MAG: c-type cytochrome [Betaproteobacteria bacterium]